MSIESRMDEAMQRLAKWRMVLSGWQLGTRAKGDPEGDAVRDHRELSLMMRVELSAVTRLLIEKGILSLEDVQKALTEEAEHSNLAHEQRFPGFTASSDGMHMELPEAAETMKGWRP